MCHHTEGQPIHIHGTSPGNMEKNGYSQFEPVVIVYLKTLLPSMHKLSCRLRGGHFVFSAGKPWLGDGSDGSLSCGKPGAINVISTSICIKKEGERGEREREWTGGTDNKSTGYIDLHGRPCLPSVERNTRLLFMETHPLLHISHPDADIEWNTDAHVSGVTHTKT